MVLSYPLRFLLTDINYWAGKYYYPRSDRDLTERLHPAAQRQGCLTLAQLHEICRWKTPRSAPKALANNEEFVREITSISFAAKNEQVRIEVLTVLCGVSWPVASTVLHYCVSDEYPILDFRALWSLEMDKPAAYDFLIWDAYVRECRRIAAEAGVSVRTLDKALWQYSKTYQPKPRSGEEE
jgi:hypothetical protein